MENSVWVVATNGNGLYYREVRNTDTTVYADRVIVSFSTEWEAIEFCNEYDSGYYDDQIEEPIFSDSDYEDW